jgi:hypothetical protein
MAKTGRGTKWVDVEPYWREVDGKRQKVGGHDRSTPKTARGPKKK